MTELMDKLPRLRELAHVAFALAVCVGVMLLDASTSSDITEAFLLPLAFIAIYPLKRDWTTVLVTVVALGCVMGGAFLEDEGESPEAMLVNRGMTAVVIVGIGFLLNRVTDSDRQLTRIATTDALTGIFNRRHFMAMLGREQQRAARYGTSFSVLMLDIDHFKRINDTFGHPVGDLAIQALAKAASKHLRPTDMIGRFGGEEFVVMLPHTDEAGSIVAAERIRETVAQVVVPAERENVTFTVSIGTATFTKRVSVEKLLECADQALYAAKRGGRNQVCVGRLENGANGCGNGGEATAHA